MYDITSITSDSYGSLTQSDSITASSTRTVNTFEVLEYDNNSNNDYALIYKDIIIQHDQTNNIERANTPYTGTVYVQLLYYNGELPLSATELHNTSQVLTSTGTRIVTYKLYYKINSDEGNLIGSIDIASFTVNSAGISQTAFGQRVYGVSIQVTEKYICYSYELNDCIFDGSPLVYGVGYNYDGPINIEDWNYNQLGDLLWSRNSQVVGIIDIANSKEMKTVNHLTKSYEVLPMAQYSVGVVDDTITVKE